MGEKATIAANTNEKLIAVTAHISIIFSLIGQSTMFLPPFSIIIPLGIWIINNLRNSPELFIRYHAKQAFFYQLAFYLLLLAVTLIFTLFSIIGIGKLRYVFYFMISVTAIGYSLYGAWQIWNNKPFRYLLVTDFIEAGEK